jgi:ATP-dependent helicase HrpB
MLLDVGLSHGKQIVVLEPRRIAARMAARRVAEELGEAVGKRIGYQVRLEDKTSAQTRVRFVTEGVLTRKLIAEPELPGAHRRRAHQPGDVDRLRAPPAALTPQ